MKLFKKLTLSMMSLAMMLGVGFAVAKTTDNIQSNDAVETDASTTTGNKRFTILFNTSSYWPSDNAVIKVTYSSAGAHTIGPDTDFGNSPSGKSGVSSVTISGTSYYAVTEVVNISDFTYGNFYFDRTNPAGGSWNNSGWVLTPSNVKNGTDNTIMCNASSEFSMYGLYYKVSIYTGLTHETSTHTLTYTNGSSTKVAVPSDPAAITGYTFSGWYTDSSYTTAYSSAAVLTADLALYAKYTAKAQYTIGTAVSISGGGTATGSGNYYAGDSVTLGFTESSNYLFRYWSSDGGTTVTSTSSTYTFTASATITYTAIVTRTDQYYINLYTESVKNIFTAAYIHCFDSKDNDKIISTSVSSSNTHVTGIYLPSDTVKLLVAVNSSGFSGTQTVDVTNFTMSGVNNYYLNILTTQTSSKYDTKWEAPLDDKTFTVSCKNSSSSSVTTMYCYAWNGAWQNASWPGTAMTLDETDNVYTLSLSKNYTKLIFNAGSSSYKTSTLYTDAAQNVSNCMFDITTFSTTDTSTVGNWKERTAFGLPTSATFRIFAKRYTGYDTSGYIYSAGYTISGTSYETFPSGYPEFDTNAYYACFDLPTGAVGNSLTFQVYNDTTGEQVGSASTDTTYTSGDNSQVYVTTLSNGLVTYSQRDFDEINSLIPNSLMISVCQAFFTCRNNKDNGYANYNDLYWSIFDGVYESGTFTDYSTTAYDQARGTGVSILFSDKVAGLQAMYNGNWGNTGVSTTGTIILDYVNDNQTMLIMTICIVGVVGFTAIGAYYFIFSKKAKHKKDND